jgi:hypothetical protein
MQKLTGDTNNEDKKIETIEQLPNKPVPFKKEDLEKLITATPNLPADIITAFWEEIKYDDKGKITSTGRDNLTYGTITAVKDATTGKISFTLVSGANPTGTYTVRFEYNEIKDPKNITNTSVLASGEKLFDLSENTTLSAAETLLNTLTKNLQNVDRSSANNIQLYAKFMSHASNIENDDAEINDNEITSAIEDLKTLLGMKYTTDLETYLDSDNWEIKTYVVDRLKQIFAREVFYEKMTIG